MADVASASVGFWVGTGSRDEKPSFRGASHFLEHLLFKGTPTRSARTIAESIDAVGGDMNAFTTKEYTAFYVRLLSRDLDLGLDVLSDIMWTPALATADLEAERLVILDEILMHDDEPADVAADLFASALYDGHPLGWEVLGSAESITAMGADDVRSFFEEHYRPENMVVAVAGDVDVDAVAGGIEKRFAGRSGGSAPVRVAPEHPGAPLVSQARQTGQVHLVVGARGPGRHDEARWALAVLNHALGGGMSSRLFQEIRERRGLAYAIWSERVGFEDTGYLAVAAGTAPGHARTVLDLVEEELDRISAEGISEHEAEVARGHLQAETLLSLEDSGARMSRIGSSLLLHGEVLTVDEILQRVDAVDTGRVAEVAARVLGSPRTLAAVGAIEGRDDLETFVRVGQPAGRGQ
ncbi:MAG: pitrilysin family protein [Actinomycetota bacterium]|nr:pitrilysin family protein [Actinomycetota bacterium]